MFHRSRAIWSRLYYISIFMLCFIFSGCSTSNAGVSSSSRDTWVPPNAEVDNKRSQIARFEKKNDDADILKDDIKLDLPMLLDLAFENSTATKKSWQAAKIAAAQSGKAYSVFFPTVKISGNFTQAEESSPARKQVGNMFYPAIDVQYSIFQFGGHTSTANAAKELLYAANYQHNRALQTLAYNVQKCYFALDSSECSIDALQKNLEDAIVTFDAAFVKHQTGLSNIQDFLQAKANKSKAEFELENARAKLELSRANLAKTIGIKVSDKLQIVRSGEEMDTSGLDIKINDLIKNTLEIRQDMLAQHSVLKSALETVSAKKSKFMPELVLGANAKTYKKSGDWHNNYNLTMALEWKIFDGLNNIYEAAEAKAKAKQAEYELKQLSLEISSDVWAKYHAFKSAIKQLNAARNYEQASQESFDSMVVSYKNGLSSFSDLMVAQNNLATARQQTVFSKNNLSLSVVELAYAVGIMNFDFKK